MSRSPRLNATDLKGSTMMDTINAASRLLSSEPTQHYEDEFVSEILPSTDILACVYCAAHESLLLDRTGTLILKKKDKQTLVELVNSADIKRDIKWPDENEQSQEGKFNPNIHHSIAIIHSGLFVRTLDSDGMSPLACTLVTDPNDVVIDESEGENDDLYKALEMLVVAAYGQNVPETEREIVKAFDDRAVLFMNDNHTVRIAPHEWPEWRRFRIHIALISARLQGTLNPFPMANGTTVDKTTGTLYFGFAGPRQFLGETDKVKLLRVTNRNITDKIPGTDQLSEGVPLEFVLGWVLMSAFGFSYDPSRLPHSIFDAVTPQTENRTPVFIMGVDQGSLQSKLYVPRRMHYVSANASTSCFIPMGCWKVDMGARSVAETTVQQLKGSGWITDDLCVTQRYKSDERYVRAFNQCQELAAFGKYFHVDDTGKVMHTSIPDADMPVGQIHIDVSNAENWMDPVFTIYEQPGKYRRGVAVMKSSAYSALDRAAYTATDTVSFARATINVACIDARRYGQDVSIMDTNLNKLNTVPDVVVVLHARVGWSVPRSAKSSFYAYTSDGRVPTGQCVLLLRRASKVRVNSWEDALLTQPLTGGVICLAKLRMDTRTVVVAGATCCDTSFMTSGRMRLRTSSVQSARDIRLAKLQIFQELESLNADIVVGEFDEFDYRSTVDGSTMRIMQDTYDIVEHIVGADLPIHKEMVDKDAKLENIYGALQKVPADKLKNIAMKARDTGMNEEMLARTDRLIHSWICRPEVQKTRGTDSSSMEGKKSVLDLFSDAKSSMWRRLNHARSTLHASAASIEASIEALDSDVVTRNAIMKHLMALLIASNILDKILQDKDLTPTQGANPELEEAINEAKKFYDDAVALFEKSQTETTVIPALTQSLSESERPIEEMDAVSMYETTLYTVGSMIVRFVKIMNDIHKHIPDPPVAVKLQQPKLASKVRNRIVVTMDGVHQPVLVDKISGVSKHHKLMKRRGFQNSFIRHAYLMPLPKYNSFRPLGADPLHAKFYALYSVVMQTPYTPETWLKSSQDASVKYSGVTFGAASTIVEEEIVVETARIVWKNENKYYYDANSEVVRSILKHKFDGAKEKTLRRGFIWESRRHIGSGKEHRCVGERGRRILTRERTLTAEELANVEDGQVFEDDEFLRLTDVPLEWRLDTESSGSDVVIAPVGLERGILATQAGHRVPFTVETVKYIKNHVDQKLFEQDFIQVKSSLLEKDVFAEGIGKQKNMSKYNIQNVETKYYKKEILSTLLKSYKKYKGKTHTKINEDTEEYKVYSKFREVNCTDSRYEEHMNLWEKRLKFVNYVEERLSQPDTLTSVDIACATLCADGHSIAELVKALDNPKDATFKPAKKAAYEIRRKDATAIEKRKALEEYYASVQHTPYATHADPFCDTFHDFVQGKLSMGEIDAFNKKQKIFGETLHTKAEEAFKGNLVFMYEQSEESMLKFSNRARYVLDAFDPSMKAVHRGHYVRYTTLRTEKDPPYGKVDDTDFPPTVKEFDKLKKTSTIAHPSIEHKSVKDYAAYSREKFIEDVDDMTYNTMRLGKHTGTYLEDSTYLYASKSIWTYFLSRKDDIRTMANRYSGFDATNSSWGSVKDAKMHRRRADVLQRLDYFYNAPRYHKGRMVPRIDENGVLQEAGLPIPLGRLHPNGLLYDLEGSESFTPWLTSERMSHLRSESVKSLLGQVDRSIIKSGTLPDPKIFEDYTNLFDASSENGTPPLFVTANIDLVDDPYRTNTRREPRPPQTSEDILHGKPAIEQYARSIKDSFVSLTDDVVDDTWMEHHGGHVNSVIFSYEEAVYLGFADAPANTRVMVEDVGIFKPVLHTVLLEPLPHTRPTKVEHVREFKTKAEIGNVNNMALALPSDWIKANITDAVDTDSDETVSLVMKKMEEYAKDQYEYVGIDYDDYLEKKKELYISAFSASATKTEPTNDLYSTLQLHKQPSLENVRKALYGVKYAGTEVPKYGLSSESALRSLLTKPDSIIMSRHKFRVGLDDLPYEWMTVIEAASFFHTRARFHLSFYNPLVTDEDFVQLKDNQRMASMKAFGNLRHKDNAKKVLVDGRMFVVSV